MEVLDDDADEHVEHEEADEEQERDEVDQAPLVEVLPGLATISNVSSRLLFLNKAVKPHNEPTAE